jgi:4-hydroxybenzoate polyprenyltransferase
MSTISGIAALSIYQYSAIHGTPIIGIILFCVVYLTSAFGFTINDVIDKEKDNICHPHRAIPRGLVSARFALSMAIGLSLVSIICSAYISISVLAINLITISLLSVYSFIKTRLAFVANMVTALLSALVIVIGMAAGSYHTVIVVLGIGTFFLILGREIVLDVKDSFADGLFVKYSVPFLLGPRNSLLLATFMFIISTFSSLVVCYLLFSPQAILFIGISYNLILWTSFVRVLRDDSLQRIGSFIVSSRYALLTIVPVMIT